MRCLPKVFSVFSYRHPKFHIHWIGSVQQHYYKIPNNQDEKNETRLDIHFFINFFFAVHFFRLSVFATTKKGWMNIFTIFWYLLKMFYQLLCCSFSFLTFLFNVFWFMCNFASAGIPWFTVMLLVICIASKFVKLRSPDDKRLQRLLAAGSQGLYPEDLSFWPIAHRGAGYDAPENSKAALKKVSTYVCS